MIAADGLDVPGPAEFPMAYARGQGVPFLTRGATPPQYLPSAARVDDALDSDFARKAEIRQATNRRQSTVATWMCPKCRTHTRPSRGKGPDLCDEIACQTPRPPYQGPPAADATPRAWRDKVRNQTVTR